MVDSFLQYKHDDLTGSCNKQISRVNILITDKKQQQQKTKLGIKYQNMTSREAADLDLFLHCASQFRLNSLRKLLLSVPILHKIPSCAC